MPIRVKIIHIFLRLFGYIQMVLLSSFLLNSVRVFYNKSPGSQPVKVQIDSEEELIIHNICCVCMHAVIKGES